MGKVVKTIVKVAAAIFAPEAAAAYGAISQVSAARKADKRQQAALEQQQAAYEQQQTLLTKQTEEYAKQTQLAQQRLQTAQQQSLTAQQALEQNKKLATEAEERARLQQSQAEAERLKTEKQREEAFNRANQKRPYSKAGLQGFSAASRAGTSGTLLTSPSGIDPEEVRKKLGKKTLLGA